MRTAVLGVLVVTMQMSATTQGFSNLGFESADTSSAVYAAEYFGWIMDAQDAFPSWSATLVYPSAPTQPVNIAFYNTYILDSSHMGIFDAQAATNSPLGERLGLPLFGSYSAYFHADEEGTLPDSSGAPSLSQTGVIPADANSLWFATSPGDLAPEINPPEHYDFFVMIDGVSISYTPMETHPDYVLWAADISSFAGMDAELRFSLDSHAGPGLPADRGVLLALDGISFSPIVVPEPAVGFLAMIGLGLLLSLKHLREPH